MAAENGGRGEQAEQAEPLTGSGNTVQTQNQTVSLQSKIVILTLNILY